MGDWADVPLEFVDPDDVENPLRFVYVVPETLDENPNNWRIHTDEQGNAVDESLDTVGWAGVALYNVETERLIDGHLRRDTAIVRGEPIPVLLGSWTEEQEAFILATLDPITAMAEADAEALDAVLRMAQPAGPATDDLLSHMAEEAELYDNEQYDPLDGMVPEDDRYEEQYGVIVMCDDEPHQEQVYTELTEAGYECKVVVT